MNPLEKTTLYTGKYLNLIKEGHWEYAARPVSGAVVIVAVTDERKLLLVEQYRIPLHARTIELPAGIVGDESDSLNEAPVEAASRELVEETGFAAGHIELLTHGPTSGGLTSEMVTFFRATKLRRVGGGGGVAHEDIIAHEVSLAGIQEWLEAKAVAGLVIDPKIYAALYFISRSS